MQTESSGLPQRQHHFDALRGFAMLLGIALHATLSLAGSPWLVRDNASSEYLKWLYEAIHGFRMQLFFFVSGYFTMLLYRRRGLNSLLEQRFQRVLVPCLLGLFVVLPIQEMITTWAADTAPQKSPAVTTGKTALVEAIRKNNLKELERLVLERTDLEQSDPEFGIPPLGWAALYGDAKVAKLLLDAGANPNPKDRDGYRPLHQAAFLGRSEVLRLLLGAGADASARGKSNDTAQDSAMADWGVTQYLAGLLRVPIGPAADMKAGREECIRLLKEHDNRKGLWESLNYLHRDTLKSYRDWLTSQNKTVRLHQQGPRYHLILNPLFGQFWFLWFLCWFLVLFAIMSKACQYVPLPRVPAGMILSRYRLLWFIPLTLIPQFFMGPFGLGFGPDTSIGLIPQPHLLLYYLIFFGVGLFYFDSQDDTGRLGRWWWLWLPLATGLFVGAQYSRDQALVTSLFQVTYVWAMIFGCIGLFRYLLGKEYRIVRYLSDSAYWLYIAHLPLVIYLQAVVRDWEYSALAKFASIVIATTAILMVSYQILVRHTYLGTILNGPKKTNRTG